ncbi:hypothetical protein L6452_35778 [Arctium lappa]|uniref:Uncharacterized protein n=1 Tax=Arctium lappa TaxID=4217 RepID=A0ACB8Y8K0_ARCLA|nr:hypothetical protein L6452_35778 [Arctium lappa]
MLYLGFQIQILLPVNYKDPLAPPYRATGSLSESAADAMENINLESEVGVDTKDYSVPLSTPNAASASSIPQGESS